MPQENITPEITSELPLTLWLQGTNNALFQQTILSKDLKKKWIIAAHWGEQNVVAKVFTQLRVAQAELKTIETLQEIGIKTPSLLHHGWLAKQPYYVLIFEKLEAANLENERWQLAENARSEVLSQIILTLAQLHEVGLRTELKFEDFLINQTAIYLLSSIKFAKNVSKQSLAESFSLKNLGFLLAQLLPVDDIKIENYYSQYIQHRNFVFTLRGLTALKESINIFRKLKMTKKNKVTAPKFVCQRKLNSFLICDENYYSQDMQKLLCDPDRFIHEDKQVIMLKAGDTCTVVKVKIDDRDLVIKRYNIKNFWHGIKRAITPSRAIKCWRSAMRLSPWRLSVAKPIALLEKRFGPFRSTAYYVTEYVPGINLAEYCTVQTPPAAELQQIAEQLRTLFANLDSLHISHGDLKATNILLENGAPILLDLDAMRLHRCKRQWQKAKQRDVNRFMKNWKDQPEIAEIFRV